VITTILVLVLLAALVAWVAGSLLLRAGGLLTFLVGLALMPAHLVAFVVALAGAIAWLAGHWLFALRHHHYRSPLARRIYLQALPARLDPTRGWAIPTTTTTTDPYTNGEQR
jgi:hypothetical protein